MAILKMKKLRLCGIAEEQTQLIRELQLLGSVEIGSPEALTGAQQTQIFRAGDSSSADALSRTSAALASALETLKQYETKKGGLFSARPEKTLDELFDDDAYSAAVQTAQEALDTQDARSRNQAEKSRLTALRESFVPWRTLDLPLESNGTQHTRVLIGTVPAQTGFDALREAVYEAAGEAQIEMVSADQQSLYLLVIVYKGAYDAAASALRESGFTQTCFDGVTGTAAENIRLTDEKLAACEQEDKRLTDKLTALAGETPAIRLAADRCTQEIAKAQAADRLAHSERTFCLDGWVPCEDVGKLETLLEHYCCAWELEDPSPEEYPDVPVKLKNNKLTWPLNMVTEMYSLPAYSVLRHHDGGHGVWTFDDPRFDHHHEKVPAQGHKRTDVRTHVLLRHQHIHHGRTDGRLLRRFPAAAGRHHQPRHDVQGAPRALHPARRHDHDSDRRHGARLCPDRDRHGHQFLRED